MVHIFLIIEVISLKKTENEIELESSFRNVSNLEVLEDSEVKITSHEIPNKQNVDEFKCGKKEFDFYEELLGIDLKEKNSILVYASRCDKESLKSLDYNTLIHGCCIDLILKAQNEENVGGSAIYLSSLYYMYYSRANLTQSQKYSLVIIILFLGTKKYFYL